MVGPRTDERSSPPFKPALVADYAVQIHLEADGRPCQDKGARPPWLAGARRHTAVPYRRNFSVGSSCQTLYALLTDASEVRERPSHSANTCLASWPERVSCRRAVNVPPNLITPRLGTVLPSCQGSAKPRSPTRGLPHLGKGLQSCYSELARALFPRSSEPATRPRRLCSGSGLALHIRGR